jgi:hypothetical protein
MNPARFEPAIPTRELQQTHPLDRIASGIDGIEISGDFLKTVIELLVCIDWGILLFS